MNQILQGQPLTIFGDGTQVRAFTHISSVAPILASSVERTRSYNQVFNVGADTPCTVLQLVEAVSKAMGVPAQIAHREARNEVQHAYCSHDKVRRHFADVFCEVDLDEGLRRMALWVRKVGSRNGQPFKNIEVNLNMPPSWRNLVTDQVSTPT
jgi:UDP-glucose 4-epimerase